MLQVGCQSYKKFKWNSRENLPIIEDQIFFKTYEQCDFLEIKGFYKTKLPYCLNEAHSKYPSRENSQV